jgi:hypothetical protein
VRLARDWEREAANWIAWARRPGHDSYWYYGGSFRELLPGPGRRTLDLGCGEGRGRPRPGRARPRRDGNRRVPRHGLRRPRSSSGRRVPCRRRHLAPVRGRELRPRRRLQLAHGRRRRAGRPSGRPPGFSSAAAASASGSFTRHLRRELRRRRDRQLLRHRRVVPRRAPLRGRARTRRARDDLPQHPPPARGLQPGPGGSGLRGRGYSRAGRAARGTREGRVSDVERWRRLPLFLWLRALRR